MTKKTVRRKAEPRYEEDDVMNTLKHYFIEVPKNIFNDIFRPYDENGGAGIKSLKSVFMPYDKR